MLTQLCQMVPKDSFERSIFNLQNKQPSCQQLRATQVIYQSSPFDMEPVLQKPPLSDGKLEDWTVKHEVDDTEVCHAAELNRKFSIWSLIAVSFSMTNSWFGLSIALITGINSGGPVLLVYGLIITALVSVAVAITLGEMASAYPDSGGQYFWTKQLAPTRHAAWSSYLTGWFGYLGALFTSTSISLAMGTAIVGLYQMNHPEL